MEIPPYVPKCSGLPTGATCSFSGVQEPYPQDTDLSITVTVPSGIAPGTYPFNVDVESGPADASVGFTLYIGDFSLQPPNASNDWAPPGSMMNVSFSLQPLDNFSGTVNITCSLDASGAVARAVLSL